MTDSQPKFKFKKRSKDSSFLKKKQLRRADDDRDVLSADNHVIKVKEEGGNNDDDDDDDDVGNSSSWSTNLPKNLVHRTGMNDDDEDAEEDSGALRGILEVERRRKLLSRKRGVDAASLGKDTLPKVKRGPTDEGERQ